MKLNIAFLQDPLLGVSFVRQILDTTLLGFVLMFERKTFVHQRC